MRGQIIIGEGNGSITAVAVHGQVTQLVRCTVVRFFSYKLSCERPVASSSGNIVNAIPGEEDLPRQQTGSPWALTDAGGDNGAMLVTVARKQVVVENPEKGPVNPDRE